MKISFNWLKEFIHIDESAEAVGQLLTSSGLEVEGIEHFEQIKGNLSGVVVGEVLTCVPHPNADKLKITTVAIGDGQVSQIVCGAPNVAAGQKVIVATVGCQLHPVSGEPFQIKKAKIRGEVSEGMICAEDEIGLGESHDGIMILSTDLPNGTPAADYFQLVNDVVFEIGLTPNRADATSHFGVARDLRALLHRPIIFPKVDTQVRFEGATQQVKTVEVIVENVEACPRYSGVVIDNLHVAPSPDWLQQRLAAIGLTPINNVVDVTNYVLHAVGQPLHAFDLQEIKGNKIIVKNLSEGTPFVTLDEKERKLAASDLMICHAEGPMCIGGVFGGLQSGVKDSTKAIFLESAYFSPDGIRKTAQRHQLKTDASFRFERGTDPDMTIIALQYAIRLLQDVCGGEVVSEITDIYSTTISPLHISVSYKNVNRLIGIAIPQEQIHAILDLLDIRVDEKTEDEFTAIVPPYRVDVTREADVIEEVLRIYGYDKVPLSEQLGSDFLANFPQPDKQSYKNTVSDLLVSNGFFEIFNNSLTNPAHTAESNLWDASQNVNILNKLSEELGILRRTMIYSGLEAIRYNISHRQSDLKFFEIGKTYATTGEGYAEKENLAIFLTGNSTPEHWAHAQQPVSFDHLNQYVQLIFDKLGMTSLTSAPTQHESFQYGLDIYLNDQILATYGLLSAKTCKKMGIKQEVFYGEIDWKKLIKKAQRKLVYREVPKFPEVRRDLSLVIDKNISFKDIKEVALVTEKKLIKRVNVFSIYEGDKIAEGKKAYAISFILQDEQKTLQDKAIDKVMNQLIRAFEENLKATIRK